MFLLLLLAVPIALHGQGTQGTNRFVIKKTWAGGLDPRPVVTSITKTQGVHVGWAGIKGPYQVQRSPSLTNPKWSNVGGPVSNKSMQVDADPTVEMEFFRVSGGTLAYAGSDACAECHETSHAGWAGTRHAVAFDTLKNIGQHKNQACIACHAVGVGLESGYVNEETSSHLKGVQCESCHGPAAAHTERPFDLSLRPVKTPSAKLCGGCHNGFHHPTFDEWNTAGHGHVTPATAAYFTGADSAARMQSCGACHSGAARLAMLYKNPLPPGIDAAETSVTCAVCHDSHGNTGHAAMLRNPTYSTNFFSYSTSTNTSFSLQYDANLNMCAQCHNQRGALPLDTSRPPHHSVQYNILIGQVAAPGTTLWTAQKNAQVRSPHTLIQAQCTQCHTHPHSVDNPSEEEPNYTGHAFEPHLANCVECHKTTGEAEAAKNKTQAEITLRIKDVKAKLDLWGQTKAPEVLRTKYGATAWEYSSPGQLSNPTGSSAIKAPTSTEQPSVPNEIKEARFYLYMVEHDGSRGIHNAKYARFLLDTAEANVNKLLAQ